MKLSPWQSTLIRLIAESPNGCWYPHRRQYLDDKLVLIGDSSVANAIKALRRKGLAEPVPIHEYACQITELGRQVAEQEKGKPIKYTDL